jgi:diguanylate cyclase (GGDEF)-like protein
MKATKRDMYFAAPFVMFALVTIGYGVTRLIVSPPESWVIVLTVIVGVVICGPFQVHLGRIPGFPIAGVAIIMLAIQPTEESPLFRVCIWAIGVAISQTIVRRDFLQALYSTGLSAAAAFAFVEIQTRLTAFGMWLPLSFLIATGGYYTLFLLGEFARHRGRSAYTRGFGISALNPSRVGALVLVVAATATLMHYFESSIVPWLEQDPDASRPSFVLLLFALVFYLLSQRTRYAGIERRLSALVDAAVTLPLEPAKNLAAALQGRAEAIVQADHVELRPQSPERDEIGSVVSLESGVDQYLIASRKVSGAPFAREDEHTLTALAHMASEAARIRREVGTLERRANTDPLTGLPNYGAFQQALVEANENRPYREGIALLFIDLDNFKKLNDNLGHPAGDELLRAVADRLQGAAGGGDFVSRVGGDEFVVILTGLVSLMQAKEFADRIIEAVSQPLTLDGQHMRPVVSAGLAFSSHRELDAQTLVMDADRSMLQVKRSRREGGPTEISSVSISSHRSTRTNDSVARAIRDDRLLLAFQPIVSIDEGKIWAFEALVRYVDPELGPISPPSLVARAKSLGLMNELTKQVITKALVAAEEFHRLEHRLHDCEP